MLTGGLLLSGASVPSSAAAQTLLERTPNVAGPWVAPPRTAHFTFLHRFELVGEESKKVVNYPTFALSAGFPRGFGAEIGYASRSELGAGTANEWEVGLEKRFALGPGRELGARAFWNTAAESADGELTVRLRLARVTLLGAARGFSDAYGAGDAGAALAGGALLHLTPRLALAADVARVVTEDSFPSAWSVGVHLAIPRTPHTLGFVVSNVGTASLQGASRGAEDEDGGANLRWGFAFTLPLGTFSQWGAIFAGDSAGGSGRVTIRDFAFAPPEVTVRAGETVRWTNEDGVAHSVRAADGSFDSGLVVPGGAFERRFDAPGRYEVACEPHPFMRAVVVVEPGS